MKLNIFSWFDIGGKIWRFDEQMKQYQRKEQSHDKCHFCCHHKVYKGRSRLIPIWLIPPTETPLPWSSFMPLSTCLLEQIIQNSLQPSLNTTLSSPSVDIRPTSRHRIPSQHQPECICGPTSSSDSEWPTDFSAIFICPRHRNLPTIVTTRGSGDQWLWAAASVIILGSDWFWSPDDMSSHSLSIRTGTENQTWRGCEEPPPRDRDNCEEI